MLRLEKLVILLIALLLVINGFLSIAFADHNGHKEQRRHQNRHRNHGEHNGEQNLPIMNNPTYKEHCGACHFAYQPELLPYGSWDKILAGLQDHFEDEVDLTPESKKIIAAYLKANAADYSTGELSRKIMRCLGNQTPLRITEIPYIQRKHHEISQDILKQESISLSNCSTCHTTAEKGVYDDDYVTIPKKTK